jgi:hypothetical protein
LSIKSGEIHLLKINSYVTHAVFPPGVFPGTWLTGRSIDGNAGALGDGIGDGVDVEVVDAVIPKFS